MHWLVWIHRYMEAYCVCVDICKDSEGKREFYFYSSCSSIFGFHEIIKMFLDIGYDQNSKLGFS